MAPLLKWHKSIVFFWGINYILATFPSFSIVKTLITLVLKEEKGNVANKKRFVDDFGGQTLFMPKTNPKPEDYSITFNGNIEDNFKIGMAITKKSIKVKVLKS